MRTFAQRLALAGIAMILAALPNVAQTVHPPRAHSTELRRLASVGYLGVGVVELTDERAQALKLKDSRGVEVKRIDDDSPAARAGLKINDVILEIDGRIIESLDHFGGAVAATQPGTTISLTIWRSGVKKTITAALDARPDNLFFTGPDMANPPIPQMPRLPQGRPVPGMPETTPKVGFEGEPVDGQLADYFGVKQGVLVRSVAPETPAARAGLKAGDVVVKVNGTPVTSPREIRGLVTMSARKPISFTVFRNWKEISIRIEITQASLPADHDAF